MSDSTVPLEDALPRWILDEPTEADIAPGGGLEDCDAVDVDDAMDGVDLPDPDQAEADHGDWSAADVDNDRLDDEETDDG